MIAAFPFFVGAIGLVFWGRTLRYGTVFGALWLTTIWMVTFISHLSRDYFASDELYFATAFDEMELFSNRFLWLALNYLIDTLGGDPVLQMRVFNLAVLLAFYALCLRAMPSFSPLVMALFMSYTACVSTLNIRDTAILISVVGFACLYVPPKRGQLRAWIWSIRATTAPAMLLLLLRPLQLFLMLIATLRWYFIIAAMIGTVAFLQSSHGTRYFYSLSYYSENYEDVVEERAEQKGFGSDAFTSANIVQWSARFIMAPLPWTSIARLWNDDEYEYGKTDLTVRAAHRIIFYGLLIAILLVLVKDWQGTMRVVRQHSFILKFCLLFTFLYAVFNFGGSHERVKLNIFFMLLLLYDRIRCAVKLSHPNKLHRHR